MSRIQNPFRAGEIDPESRNRFLLVAGLSAVVLFALGLILVGYYVDRVKPRSETVFSVGDRKFSYSYLEDRADAAYADGTFNLNNFSVAIATLVSDIQNEELTRRIAAEEGVTISQEELEAGMKDDLLVNQQASRTTFATALRAHLQDLGLSLDRYEEIIEADLLQQKMVDQLQAALPAQLEQVQLSIILVQTDAAAADARKRITDGEDFGEVAKAVSQHSSAADGGAVGWTPRDLLLDQLAEAVFSQEPGTISDVIETDTGFYIAKVDAREDRELDEGTQIRLARTYFGDKLEDASNRYELTNTLTVGQAQRIANHMQVSGG